MDFLKAVANGSINMLEPANVQPPLGVIDDITWPAVVHELPEQWSLLLYTDGLIEGRTGVGSDRLGGEGLEAMVRGLRDETAPALLTTLVERAEELNGGPMLDDVAAFLVQRR